MRSHRSWIGLVLVLLTAGACEAGIVFKQTNLVSSVDNLAPVTDANLKNPWGISMSSTGPFWVSNQVTGTSTLYNGQGQKFPIGNPLVVSIPSASGAGPTGQVFNASSSFQLEPGKKANFIFANLDGSISGWNPTVNPTTAIKPYQANDGAVYTGLAIGKSGSSDFLYAADSANGKIDVIDGSFVKTSLAGNFTDPGLGSGFTPYNIQNIGGTLYVTYENEQKGGGIIDAFDLNGNFLRRLTSNGDGGTLASPWGMAVAPSTWKEFAGALLVGNEDDGRISAFNLTTGDFLGQLKDSQGNFITNTGLWGLTFGNGGNGGDKNTLYFAAGIRGETEGLFGSLSAVPEPSSVVLLALGIVSTCGVAMRRRTRTQ
jgi:uncharacterized protein (TIGR03118 family)